MAWSSGPSSVVNRSAVWGSRSRRHRAEPSGDPAESVAMPVEDPLEPVRSGPGVLDPEAGRWLPLLERADRGVCVAGVSEEHDQPQWGELAQVHHPGVDVLLRVVAWRRAVLPDRLAGAPRQFRPRELEE